MYKVFQVAGIKDMTTIGHKIQDIRIQTRKRKKNNVIESMVETELFQTDVTSLQFKDKNQQTNLHSRYNARNGHDNPPCRHERSPKYTLPCLTNSLNGRIRSITIPISKIMSAMP